MEHEIWQLKKGQAQGGKKGHFSCWDETRSSLPQPRMSRMLHVGKKGGKHAYTHIRTYIDTLGKVYALERFIANSPTTRNFSCETKAGRANQIWFFTDTEHYTYNQKCHDSIANSHASSYFDAQEESKTLSRERRITYQ